MNIVLKVTHEIAGLRDSWLHLQRVGAEKVADGELPSILFSYYQSYEWNEFLHRNYGRMLMRRIDYIYGEGEGEVLFILPLLVDKLRHRIEILSGRIAGILNMVCPYGRDKIGGGEFFDLLRFMAERYKGYKFRFNDMPRQSPLFEALISSGRKYSERGSFHIPLDSFGSFDDYVASLGRNIYKNIRKSYNHIATDGRSMSIEVYDKEHPVPAPLMRKIWCLYFTRKLAWKRSKATALRRMVSYLRGLREATVGRKAASMICLAESRVITLMIDGKLAAFTHIYVYGDYVLMPKLAIDASYSRYSPGIVIVLETLKMLMAQGVKDFDMCRGDERYKREVGGLNQPLGSITIASVKPDSLLS